MENDYDCNHDCANCPLACITKKDEEKDDKDKNDDNDDE